MPSDVAATASPSLPVAGNRPDPANDGRPETSSISFDDLWKNKKEGFTFSDFLDIVNPLQHLPIVSSIYRAITGDEPSIGARLIGGALYGGPIGVASEAAVAAVDQVVGGDPGQKVIAWVGDLFDGGSDTTATKVAKVEPAAGGNANATIAVADAASVPATAARPTVDKSAVASSLSAAAANPGEIIAAPGVVPVLVPAGAKPAAAGAAVAAAAPPPAATPHPAAATPPLREFPAFPRPRPAPNRGVMMPLRPGLGGQQMMPLRPELGGIPVQRTYPFAATAPKSGTAPHANTGMQTGARPTAPPSAGPQASALPVGTQSANAQTASVQNANAKTANAKTAGAKTADSDSKRIAAEIAAAQRAQTGLLLASLAGSATTPSSGLAGDDGSKKSDERGTNPADPFKNHPMLPPSGASPAWVSRAMEQALMKYRRSQQLRQTPSGNAGASKPLVNGAAASGAGAAPPGP